MRNKPFKVGETYKFLNAVCNCCMKITKALLMASIITSVASITAAGGMDIYKYINKKK